MPPLETRAKEHLFVSDFDQTLSFNDSGLVLSELIGVKGFLERIRGLADIHLVQQGGELAYLLLHDPEFRCVRARASARSWQAHSFEGQHRASATVAGRSGWPPLLLLRGLRGAARSHPVGARGHHSRRPHHRHGIPLRARDRRDPVHRAGSRGLRQSRRAGAIARHPAHQPRPHHVRGRRQFRRPRDVARQSAGTG